MKAMLLAAGQGTRLKPLTDKIPKPLISIGQHSLIEHNLLALKKAGVDEVVINVCHHAKQIMDALGDGQRYGLNIQYSYEKDSTRGTGGGILQALPLLGQDPFLVISADIWTEFPFGPSIMDSKSEVYLVLVESPSYHPKGDYALSETGKVQLEGRKLTYGGIAKLHPNLFKACEHKNFSLSPLLNEAVKRGTANGEVYRGTWFNVGTVEELARLKEALQVK